jgi:hypothetical protein
MRRKWIVWLSIVVLLAGLLPGAGPALAGGPDLPSGLAQGDDFLISRAEGTIRGQAAIAYNNDLDEYLVVWSDGRGNALYWDIYGQIVTGGGIPKGSTFVIRDEAATTLAYPDVAYDTVNQRYLVVWYDLTEVDVEGQLLNNAGSAFGSAFNVAEGTSGDIRGFPAVAFYPHASSGKYAVVYYGGSAGDYNIYSRFVSMSGVVSIESSICTAPDDQTDPDVAVDPAAGHFLIVWEDGRSTTDQIYGRIQWASGWLDPEFKVSVVTNCFNPAVAFNTTTDEWLVAFEREVSGHSQIAGRRVDASGIPQSPDPITICDDSADQRYPDVAYSSYGNQWLVVWEDHRVSQYDVYGRRVDASGNPMGSGAFAICAASDYQSTPVVSATDNSHGYLVVFKDSRTDDICGQLVLTAGTLQGHEFTISAPLNQQKQPAIAYNSTNTEFLVVWHDRRNETDWNIWGQRVDLDGTLLGESFALCTDAADQLNPDVAYNSATNKYLVVWDDRRTDADIYGQRVNGGTGTLDGSNFAIADLGTTQRHTPRVVFNSVPSPDEFFVVYTYATEADNIRGRRLNADGTPLAAEIDIATGANEQDSPDVACRAIATGGSYLVVWHEVVGAQGDIKGQRLSAAGAWLGNYDICTEIHAQPASRLAYSPEADRYLVAWTDDRNSATQGRNVYGRQMSGAGTLYTEFAISTANGDQAHLAVGYSGAMSSYAVIWDDTRNAGTTPDLYGQRVNSTGSLVDTGVSTNDLIYTGLGAQEYPAVAWSQTVGQGLVAWQDSRAGATAYHVYGRRLEAASHSIFLPLVLKN